MTKQVLDSSFSFSFFGPPGDNSTFFYVPSHTVLNWQHTILAYGGFDTASFDLVPPINQVDDWIEQGLGRRVVAYGPRLEVIWEGFINKISISQANSVWEVGPLIGVANKVRTMYTPLLTTTTPPTAGPQTLTSWYEDTESQALFGIWQATLSSSAEASAQVAAATQTWLANRAWPSRRIPWQSPDGDFALSVECVGYHRYLEAYEYEYTAGTGTQYTSAKIKAILDADPNGFIDPSRALIDTNTLSTTVYEDSRSKASELIKTLVDAGDSNGNRWLFGIYENRVPQYHAAPTTIDYQAFIGDSLSSFRGQSGADIPPWSVRPGKWIRIDDLKLRYQFDMALAQTNNTGFIESVTYTMPYGLQVDAGLNLTIQDRLSALGLTG